jgi:hypothetical protein
MLTLAALEGSQILIVIAMGISVPIIAIVAGSIRRSSAEKQRELSRRDIAAYVAEGSMTPEEGRQLLEAGTKKRRSAAAGSVVDVDAAGVRVKSGCGAGCRCASKRKVSVS